VSVGKDLTRGILAENPTFRLLLGMCPTLAISTSVMNGIGMGLAATFVLIGSNLIISLVRSFIPDKIRIPCYITIIAMFVTVVDLVMAGFTPALHETLGIFIPLIVVNCIILQRAESFASKKPVINSIADGLGMGLGFTLALTVLSLIRETLGTGAVLAAPDFNFAGLRIIPEEFKALIVVMAPGGFITLGLVLGFINWLTRRVGVQDL
jgi:electron transport complex protein RnfE